MEARKGNISYFQTKCLCSGLFGNKSYANTVDMYKRYSILCILHPQYINKFFKKSYGQALVLYVCMWHFFSPIRKAYSIYWVFLKLFSPFHNYFFACPTAGKTYLKFIRLLSTLLICFPSTFSWLLGVCIGFLMIIFCYWCFWYG